MIIYLDFDGTVVEHEYPDIGKYNKGSFDVIKKLQNSGHEIILNTYRADCNNGTLEEAIEYLNTSDKIEPVRYFEDIKISPEPWNWTVHKYTGTIFLDDITPGIPTIENPMGYDMVDWNRIDEEFIENGLY